jgi:hypothetical protein
MHARPIRWLSEWLQSVEGSVQKRRVVTVGWGDGPKRDAPCVHHRRAFDASFPQRRQKDAEVFSSFMLGPGKMSDLPGPGGPLCY